MVKHSSITVFMREETASTLCVNPTRMRRPLHDIQSNITTEPLISTGDNISTSGDILSGWQVIVFWATATELFSLPKYLPGAMGPLLL
jgi:hypothetical protein